VITEKRKERRKREWQKNDWQKNGTVKIRHAPAARWTKQSRRKRARPRAVNIETAKSRNGAIAVFRLFSFVSADHKMISGILVITEKRKERRKREWQKNDWQKNGTVKIRHAPAARWTKQSRRGRARPRAVKIGTAKSRNGAIAVFRLFSFVSADHKMISGILVITEKRKERRKREWQKNDWQKNGTVKNRRAPAARWTKQSRRKRARPRTVKIRAARKEGYDDRVL